MNGPFHQPFGQFAWGHPGAFALLPVVLWLVWQGLRRRDLRPEARSDVTLVHPDLQGVLHSVPQGHRPPLRSLLGAGAFACWVAALAQPQVLGQWIWPPARGRDVIVVLDTTRSMTLNDLRWNGQPAERLSVVKQVFANFVRRSPGDRFGIIAFGARAATLLPPTFDGELAVEMLGRAHANLLGDGGCLGDAMSLALRQVAARGGLKPVLVVYSDNGWQKVGQVSPAQATALARALGVRVFTVQVGDREASGKPYTVPAFQGPQPDLATIAQETGGRYFYAVDGSAQARAIQAIARLAPTLQPPPQRRAAQQLYPGCVMLGLLLFASGQLLRPGQGRGSA
ncbi:MAG: VWA domain-containing protein [Betaproteobacteria bacterium]|nr:VWA domain-containing protein [Betaproteobacteria bacterium]